jgi:glycosyltransferase involved in cell wall biosynthesis
MKKVIIIYRYIPHYRKKFYELLKSDLMKSEINLEIIYGNPGAFDSKKNDSVELSWGIKIKNYIFPLGNREIYWQPVLTKISKADLIIVEQASKLLINYILIFLNFIKWKKVAFWGHGKNFQQENSNIFGEWIKKKLSTKVHWWFAYNDLSASIVKTIGFPHEKITSVQNSIDQNIILYKINTITPKEINLVKAELNLIGKNIGLFVGGMYYEKKIRFLLESCKIIKEYIPDFEMLFIGDGVDSDLVNDFAERNNWVHYLGTKFGEDLVPYYLISHVFMMPGLVGLSLIDCFTVQLPLVTMKNNNHSPEIDYLKNNINGLIIDETDDPKIYSSAVINVLLDSDLRKKLKEGCENSSKIYSIDEMVDRFSQGIIKALKADF